MSILPDIKPGEAKYATSDEWLSASDLAEADICLPIAPRVGKVLWLRYRALTLAEEQEAWRAARAVTLRYHLEEKLPPPGPDDVDNTALMLETIQRGVIQPRLSPAAARELVHKSPYLVGQVYRAIATARSFTPEGLEDAVNELIRTRTTARAAPAAAAAGDGDAAALGQNAGGAA